MIFQMLLFVIWSADRSRSSVLVLHRGVVLLPLASALRIGGHKAQSKFPEILCQISFRKIFKSMNCAYMFVLGCVGLQRADHSPHRHHFPHRVLLLCELRARGNPGDAHPRLFWLPVGGKSQNLIGHSVSFHYDIMTSGFTLM